MNRRYKATIICTLFIFLLTAGCSQAQKKTDAPLATAPKAEAETFLTAQAGPVTIKGKPLAGYSFTDYSPESICGMTRWQDKLVLSEYKACAKNQPILLRAFNLEAKKGTLTPAKAALHDGMLSPASLQEDAYTHPAADADGYLYFQTRKGFRSFKKVGVGPLDITYGQARLLIAEDGKTAYAVNKSLAAKGTLVNGLFTYAKNINPATVIPDFGMLRAGALGRGGNNRLYILGHLKKQNPANVGIGIVSPELTLERLAETAPKEITYDSNRPPLLHNLAVTDKYILSWKAPSKNTVANLYLWDTDGHYLGQAAAGQILGDGWQPEDAAVWEHNTLIVAACKLTDKKEVRLGEGASVRMVEQYIWTWNLFLVQLD